ncbi:MAG: DUF1398 family protein [Candidatus Omnitrophota bacterium]|nr:DUF1398 family protein [Candidatus Omnitrophota bacterium]
MDTTVLKECTALAFQNKITFPETVKRLAETGVERYCADLVRLEKFYYAPTGQNDTVAMPLENPPTIAMTFSQKTVQEAIRASQKGQIDYAEFLRRIMKAGVVYYDIFIQGRKAIYTGRNGDFHVENFPVI